MSRHLVTAFDPELVVWVGWDDGLETYFAQVEPPGIRTPRDLLLWVGSSPGEVGTADELARLLESWTSIDAELVADLANDRAAGA
jgi:hypothetical protein